MDIFQTLLQVFGGLAIFIYGVHLLSEGLEKVAGDRFLSILEKATGNRFKGFLFGTVATALMQSSGLLMVTMIGLINASLLSLEQAIGIMLGQEIGTTITGQMVAFNIRGFNLLFLIIGFYLMFFNSSKKWQQIGQPLFGFGVVFVGMNMMSSAAGSFSQLPFFRDLLVTLSRNVFLGVLVGTIFTAAIQSSTAMTGLIIAMGKSNSITLVVAIALILGANIGSCIMGWLASIQSTVNAKRASYAQIFINIGGVLLFLPFIAPFTDFISKTSADLPRQIANAHTIFNIIVSALMIPLVSLLARFLEKVIPNRPEEEQKKLTRFLDDRFLNTPFVAVSLAKEEVLRLGRLTLGMLKDAEKGYLQGKLKSAQSVLDLEPDIDQICHIVTKFMEDVPGEKLNLAEHAMLERLKHLVTDIERVGDHAVNLAEFARQIDKKKIKISKEARRELKELFHLVSGTYATSLKAFKKSDRALVDEVVRDEDEVDRLEKKCKRGHVERLRKGLCQPEADPIYVETLRNLERISDHSYNIALSLIY
jgi:phosphate:Na+ symporter